MTTLVRMMPPANGLATTSITTNGRTYTCAAAATVDVPDFDAGVLRANGWIETANAVGATAARPANPRKGQTFYDSTLSKAIVFDGKVWRDPGTGAAV